jgi:hypothetical protein
MIIGEKLGDLPEPPRAPLLLDLRLTLGVPSIVLLAGGPSRVPRLDRPKLGYHVLSTIANTLRVRLRLAGAPEARHRLRNGVPLRPRAYSK